MKRLTEQYYGEWVTEHAEEMDYFLIKGKAIDRLAAYEDTDLTPEEVAELAQAKHDGRLVVLPCKVGTKVYGIEGNRVGELIYVGTVSGLEEFGRTWFLTREEAEQALEKMKGDK